MYADNFPLLTNSTYLNTAYVGPMSLGLAEFRRKQEEVYVQKGGDYKSQAYETLEETHNSIAHFFGAQPDHTFVIPNFSVGIRHALSLFTKKLEVLLVDEDYPSLEAAFEEGNFNLHKVPMQNNLEEVIEQKLTKERIDILALSIVQYASGLLIDIEFLKDLKERYPDLLIVGDGTQFLGAHHFHFDTAPFDVVVASGYKWMLAGFGNGVLMISQAYLDRIRQKKTVLYKRVFNGHFNILAAVSLKFAVSAFEEQGFDKLILQKEKLTEKVKQALSEYEFIPSWVSHRKQHSSIFILEGKENLYEELLNQNIQCVKRGKGVRVSFHYYNTEEDLDKLISALKNTTT